MQERNEESMEPVQPIDETKGPDMNMEEIIRNLHSEPPHNHSEEQGITLGVNTVIELMQNRTDYERLINVILMNTRLSYDGKLISKENSNILDYLSLVNPNIEEFIKEKTQELKNEEEK